MKKPDRGSRQNPLQLRLRQIDTTLAALGELLAALTKASELLKANRRQGWVYALDAVYRLLDTLDRNDADHTKVPVATLMAALQDLDLGTVDPALRPANRQKGGQLSGYDQVVIRALAAAATGSLLKPGRTKPTKPEAALIVVRELDKLGVPIGNTRNLSIKQAGKTVEKWRDRLEKGSDQPRAVELYKSFKEKLRFPPGTSIDGIVAGLPKLLSEALAGRIQKSN
jgi:hypothetical protein